MIGMRVIGADAVVKRLTNAHGAMRLAQEQGVRRGTALLERALKLELSQPGVEDPFWGKKGAAGDGLAVRSGKTRASIAGGGQALRVGNRVIGAVGSPDKHLLDHEKGGTFQGKSPAGYARVPTAAMQTGAGVDRLAGASIRSLTAAFLFKSKAGRLWAAMKGRGNELVLLYLLVKSITLRPRGIFERVKREKQPAVVLLTNAEVGLVVKQANG